MITYGRRLGSTVMPFGRNDAQERVVDGTRQRASVHDRLVVEVKHRRQALPLVLEEVVAALAQRVPEQDGSLREVDGVLRSARERLPRHDRSRLRGAGRGFERILHTCVVALDRELGARLEELRDLGGYVVAFGKLRGGVGHGITLADRWVKALRRSSRCTSLAMDSSSCWPDAKSRCWPVTKFSSRPHRASGRGIGAQFHDVRAPRRIFRFGVEAHGVS